MLLKVEAAEVLLKVEAAEVLYTGGKRAAEHGVVANLCIPTHFILVERELLSMVL